MRETDAGILGLVGGWGHYNHNNRNNNNYLLSPRDRAGEEVRQVCAAPSSSRSSLCRSLPSPRSPVKEVSPVSDTSSLGLASTWEGGYASQARDFSS